MNAVFLKSVLRAADIPESNKPQIALLGRSNVGKSSLINRLAGAKGLAYSSNTPGLTQTVNLYEFDGRYLLVDLPGYGFARAKPGHHEGFAPLIGAYLSEAERLKLVLLIVDARHDLAESDRHAIGQLIEERIPFVIVLNKTDKVSRSAAVLGRKKIETAYPGAKVIAHSMVTGEGLGEIRDAIARAVREAASGTRS